MKCTHRGCSAWSRVLETRTQDDGSVWRRHECANLHQFGSVQRPEPRADFLERRSRQIVREVLAGRKLVDVARRFGLSTHSEVSRLMRREQPGFDARAHGQRLRWQEHREKRGSNHG